MHKFTLESDHEGGVWLQCNAEGCKYDRKVTENKLVDVIDRAQSHRKHCK